MANDVPEDMECPACHGTGRRAGEVCNLCGGSGRIPVTQYPPGTNPFEKRE